MRARRGGRARRPWRALIAVLALAVGPLVTVASCSRSSDTGPISNAEIAATLAQHGRAVRTHDRREFLDGIDAGGSAAGFRAAQDSEFQNLELLPLRSWSYTMTAPARAPGAEAAARRRFGASARIVEVALRYAIRGVDPVATSHILWWTFARIGGRVVVCSDDALDHAGGISWQGPWDFGPMAVVRGAHCLVLGEAGQSEELHRIADVVDRAVPAVTAVWGRNWTRDVAVLVPPTPAALDAALGDAGEPDSDAAGSDTAAVTVTNGIAPMSGRAEEQRVVVTEQAFDELSALGRRIVFTHEVTHVASADYTGQASPRWLVEGLAEYVANLHTGQPVRSAARELVTQIRHDGIPRALPSEGTFDTASTAAAAYEQAWLACRLIAQRAGPAGLVRLYRVVGASGSTIRNALHHGLGVVLHQSLVQFTADWRRYLREELG